MSDIVFVDGLRVYAPNDGAPDYIIANFSLERDALTAWLAQHGDKVRVVIKRSKGGKYYAAVDDYKPREAQTAPSRAVANAVASVQPEFQDDEIPF